MKNIFYILNSLFMYLFLFNRKKLKLNSSENNTCINYFVPYLFQKMTKCQRKIANREKSCYNKNIKRNSIIFSYTMACPRTMMIHPFHTYSTIITMRGVITPFYIKFTFITKIKFIPGISIFSIPIIFWVSWIY